MFGTLRPHPCVLDETTHTDYRRLYCGTCKGIGTHFGFAQRVTLTWDVVLLAATVDALLCQDTPQGSCRCPVNPLTHRDILTPESVPMQVASAVQILLTDQWVADQHRDGSRFAALVRPLTAGSTRHANELLAGLGIDTQALNALDTRQGEAECSAPTVAQAAEPTAYTLGDLFCQLASLPDTAEADPLVLRDLGHGIGSAIYVIDALEDLEKDLRHADFNPCLVTDNHIEGERVEDCVNLLLDAVAVIERCLSELPLQRHRTLLQHILVDQLPRRADVAVNGARDAVFRQWRAMTGSYDRLEEADEPEPDEKTHASGSSCCVCDCGPISGLACGDLCCGSCECASCCDLGCCCG